jgi:hypothetical protein
VNLIGTRDYQGNCWWCGSIADSREHKYKSTDLKREFGKYSYKGENKIVRVGRSEDGDEIQGPNSDIVKFRKTICRNCNAAKSKEMDSDYNLFIEYLKDNEDEIYKSKSFNSSAIFSTEWKEKILSVKRYFVKHICCHLAEVNIEIQKDAIDFLNGSNNLESISMGMALRKDKMDWVKMSKRNGEGGGIIMLGVEGFKMDDTDSFKWIRGYYDYRGFSFLYFYSLHVQIKSNLDLESVILDEIDNPEYFRIKEEKGYK